jgi:hypothetical protein
VRARLHVNPAELVPFWTAMSDLAAEQTASLDICAPAGALRRRARRYAGERAATDDKGATNGAHVARPTLLSPIRAHRAARSDA